MNFRNWTIELNKLMVGKIGVPLADLPIEDWKGIWESGSTPIMAYNNWAIENYGKCANGGCGE